MFWPFSVFSSYTVRVPVVESGRSRESATARAAFTWPARALLIFLDTLRRFPAQAGNHCEVEADRLGPVGLHLSGGILGVKVAGIAILVARHVEACFILRASSDEDYRTISQYGTARISRGRCPRQFSVYTPLSFYPCPAGGVHRNGTIFQYEPHKF